MASQTLSQHSQQTGTLLNVSHQDDDELTPKKGEYRDNDSLHQSSSTDSGSSPDQSRGPEVGETQFSVVIADSLPQRLAAEAAAAAVLEMEAQLEDNRVMDSSGHDVHADGGASRPSMALEATQPKLATTKQHVAAASKPNDDDLYTLSPGAARSSGKTTPSEMGPRAKPQPITFVPNQPVATMTLFGSQKYGELPVATAAPTVRKLTGVVLATSRAAGSAINDLLEGDAVAEQSSLRPRYAKPPVPVAIAKVKDSSQARQEDQMRQSTAGQERVKADPSASSAGTKPVRKTVQDLDGGRPMNSTSASARDALRARRGLPPVSTRTTNDHDDANDETNEQAASKTAGAASASSKKIKQLPTPASNPAITRSNATRTGTSKLPTYRTQPMEDSLDAGVGISASKRALVPASGADAATELGGNTVASSAHKSGALKRPIKAAADEQRKKRRKETFDMSSDEQTEEQEAPRTQRKGVTKQSKSTKPVLKPTSKKNAALNSAPDTRRRERSQSRVSLPLNERSVAGSRIRQRMAQTSTKAPTIKESRRTKASIEYESKTAKVIKERAPLPKQLIASADKENADPTLESYEDFEDTVVQYADDRPGHDDAQDENANAQARQSDPIRSVSGRVGPTVIDLESQAAEQLLPLVTSKPNDTALGAITFTKSPPAIPVKAGPAATEIVTSRPARSLGRPQTPSVLPSSPPQRTRDVRESRKPQVIAFDAKGPRNQGTPSMNVHSETSARFQRDQSRYSLRSTPAEIHRDAQKQVPEIPQANVAIENEDIFAAFMPGRREDVLSSPTPPLITRKGSDIVQPDRHGHDKVLSALEQETDCAHIDDFEGTTLVDSTEQDAQPTASQVAMPPPGGQLKNLKKANRPPTASAMLEHQGTEPRGMQEQQDVKRVKRKTLETSDMADDKVIKRQKKKVTYEEPEELEPETTAKAVQTGCRSGPRSSAAQSSASFEPGQLLEGFSKQPRRSVAAAQLPDDTADPQQQEKMLYDALYPKVHAQHPGIANKLTGMLLQIDRKELVGLTTDDVALSQHLNETKRIHDDYVKNSNKQNGMSQPRIRPVVVPVNRRRTRTVRQGSQGYQRVDITGSPIPKGMNVPPRGTAVGTFLSQSKMSSDEALDSRVAAAKIDDGLGLPLNDQHLAPPSAQPRNVMSSNTKPVPAPPHEESRAITRRVSGADAAKLVAQRERSDPFNPPDDQSSGELTAPFTTKFRQQLRQHFGDPATSGESQPADEAMHDEDPDKTLVEPVAQFARRVGNERTLIEQPALKRVISIASTASTSGSDISSVPSSNSTQEHDSIATWRNALRPHQSALFDALVVVSHKLVKHVVKQEIAARDTLNDYRLQGEKLVKMMEESHLEAYAKQINALEKHKRKMMKELAGQAERLAGVVEQLADQREKSRAADEGEGELNGNLAELMSMVA
ncbi:Protein phosphatase PP2A regulatory subunit B [Oleoguttula sp. CCFEE 5521]